MYGRIYTPRENFRFSRTNDLILNLKISPTQQERRRYKEEAIRQFVFEVSHLLQHNLTSTSLLLVPMPPSKAKSHPEHDNRLEIVASQVAAQFEAITYFPCLETATSYDSVHRSRGPRSVSAIYESITLVEEIAQEYVKGNPFLLLDDILTSGAHFATARRRLLERFPSADVKGLFGAKSQQAMPFDGL